MGDEEKARIDDIEKTVKRNLFHNRLQTIALILSILGFTLVIKDWAKKK